MTKSKSHTKTVYKSAKTGLFVTESFANKHKATTFAEKVILPSHNKPKKK